MKIKNILSLLLVIYSGACGNIKGGITGKVIDEQESPLAGARVVVYDERQEKTVYDQETGENGKFEYYETNFVVFNGYCGPTLTVTVSKPGFIPVGKEFSHLCELKEYNPILKRE